VNKRLIKPAITARPESIAEKSCGFKHLGEIFAKYWRVLIDFLAIYENSADLRCGLHFHKYRLFETHRSIPFSNAMLFDFSLRASMPGVARRLLTFFASAKKVSKESRARDVAPSGCPPQWQSKREMKQTRLRLRQVSFLIRFDRHCGGDLQAQFVGCNRNGF
jgi:hypothetical protein